MPPPAALDLSHPDEVEPSQLSPKSPMDNHSRSLTLEEGEVFRKGTLLGSVKVESDDEELGDVSGEELKKEVSLISRL